jgi:hypothetical protein
MHTTDPVISPPISGTANAATVTANVVMAIPGTRRKFAPPAAGEWPRHDSVMRRTSPRGLAITPEAIP